jgi:hypothetical protein
LNVKDYDIPIPEGDMLEIIFAKQRELMNRYHAIEEQNVGHAIPYGEDGYGPYCGALDVDDRASQLRFKDFAWRITEELTEATLAIEDRTHYEEELIDALHFSVELLILCGFQSSDFAEAQGDTLEVLFNKPMKKFTLTTRVYSVIEKLGEAMNRLKLKPWKTSAMLTDREAFIRSIFEFFELLIDLLKASGFTARSATAMYLNKHAVNQFRQSSAY